MRTQAQSQSALQAGRSDLHPTTFHTPSPHNQDDGPNPDPDYPDGDPDGGGSSDRDIPEDLAELPEDPLIALARAVHVLAWSSSCTGDSAPKTKVHKPDTFDSSDPKKLCEFLVTFTQSHLKGMALAWFEPDLLNPNNYDHPLWMDNYHKFLQELTTNFSPHDAIADAVQQPENLTMKDGSRITKYVVEFNCWASQVKDYGVIRKPSTLAQFHKLTQTIDACYWECKAEILHTTKSTSDKLQSSNSDNKSKLSSSASTPKSNAKGKDKQKDLPKSDDEEQPLPLLWQGWPLCQGLSRSTSCTAKACAAMAGTLPTLPTEKAEQKN
ncbi:hypothetical protein M404DRAFT_21286 [Pisolithus tinctorius Marx 270]|uniref:Retrotransposon gag domain-containing protein n=1 Tax=Pisolithus tinctorius Marx 270 TaxID=870435 RepID=A0A0C3KL51_PISTI|nr:hypothetical protein M404DRAFT_21286 [Pisolithus tinctorius Marx 270]